ncbi:hypothetical protein [Picosynechococcus sp. PCC 7117]|uniref:hypothetical protein n=1 Tax=Picosynechococcus sp. PCC 7117 TaxID=195498 RepID=UPI000810743D|nr:hypothetical protein [Picosynechococcus sp. PCC 7117]ANV85998.1 hypothetical protein AWQ22_00060 [Picosynechococcus sp. PCC 7117]
MKNNDSQYLISPEKVLREKTLLQAPVDWKKLIDNRILEKVGLKKYRCLVNSDELTEEVRVKIESVKQCTTGVIIGIY